MFKVWPVDLLNTIKVVLVEEPCFGVGVVPRYLGAEWLGGHISHFCDMPLAPTSLHMLLFGSQLALHGCNL